jgi:hypothetical protein
MLRTRRQLEAVTQTTSHGLHNRCFLAPEIPPTIDRARVKGLCIEGDGGFEESRFTDIPDTVHSFPHLEYLRLPKRYVPELRPQAFPSRVRVLEIVGDGAIGFPEEITFPHVQRLTTDRVALRFGPQTFPRLKHLQFLLDSRRSMLAVLPELKLLQTLSIGPNRDGEIFRAVGASALRALNLAGGTMRALGGIERLESLTAIGLRSLDKLEDIDALTQLPKLNDVMITWCAKLSDYRPLLRLSALDYLDVFGCKNFDVAHYGPKLQTLRLKGLSLPPEGWLHRASKR